MEDLPLGPFVDAPGYQEAAAADARDPLRAFADRFVPTDPGLIYLDGNSLGRLPVATVEALRETVATQWGVGLIRSWNDGWWDLAGRIGDRIAPLIGARPGEVTLADSTTINLHKAARAAVAARPGRLRIVTDDLNFPSDLYVLAQVAESIDGTLTVVGSDGVEGPVEAVVDELDDSAALVSLSATAYGSGYTYDLGAVTTAAHAVGALVCWDLSHTVGAVEIDMEGSGADLAVGCTYKFLCGGPGAPAFLYVRASVQDQLVNPLVGWCGDDDPFGFGPVHRPAAGIGRFRTGSPPVLSLTAVGTGVDLVAEAGMAAIAAKGRELVAMLETLVDDRLAPFGVRWASPREPSRRGAHGTLRHPEAWPLTQALIAEARVVPDFRVPDQVRFGLSPLTTSFVDVHTAVERLARVLADGRQHRYPRERHAVT